MKTNRIMQNAERKTQQAAGSRQQAAGSKQQAAGGQASGVRVQESGVRGQEAGVRSQESGVRSQSVPPSALHSSFIIHHSSFSASASARQRRGVLILVVLSLLVMFALMALTYVLVANKFLSKSKLDARAEANATNPQKEIESAFLQLIRDTSNEHSAMRGHALLPDEYGEPAQFWNSTLGIIQYGPNSVKGYIGTPFNPLAGNQLIDFVATYPANMSPSLIEGYYEGSVITMTTGVARGLSSRIVRYYNGSNQQHFRVVAFKGSSGPVVPNPGDEFLINGRAFTGTGTGFNSATGHLDARDSKGREFALLPNAAHYDPLGGDYDQGTPNVADDPMDFPFGGLGGANEDYDGPDNQNLHMSLIAQSGGGQPQVILPSFHRPDLANYWLKRMQATSGSWNWATDADSKKLLRQIVLRPTPIDHPNFDGSNPNLAYSASWQTNLLGVDGSGNPLAVSPWDVDNDGDGVADSVWLDLGFTVRTMLDGRKYKPLFAFHVVDLDGRINLNAHGSTDLIDNPHTNQIPVGPFAGTNGNTPLNLPRGQGYGPAEVDLSVSGLLSATEISNIMRGATIGSVSYDGRYGTSGAASTNGSDYLGLVKHFQFPDAVTPQIPSAFRTVADLWGRSAVGVDYLGQPLVWKSGTLNEALYCPYDLNLSRNVANTSSAGSLSADNPFSVYELERLLRPWDIDSYTLPQRLYNLLPSSAANARTRMTTDSWDLPSPSIIFPEHLRKPGMATAYESGKSIPELLRAAWLNQPAPNQPPSTNYPYLIRQMLPWDLLAGRRMDINRPFGDGRDSDGNGVVDEPTLSEMQKDGQSTAFDKWTWLSVPALNTAFSLNVVNGTDVDGDGKCGLGAAGQDDRLMARQLMAKHLYLLARLLIDNGYLPNTPVALAPHGNVQWYGTTYAKGSPQSHELAIRRIAQWAVNVVDFMDSDSICTPFEYDVNPFTVDNAGGQNTWEVDGILGNGSPDDTSAWRRVVWGCERPELLITEAFAFHDRRSEDLSAGNGKTTDMPQKDMDFDQRLQPRSGLFFEIYNPWVSAAQQNPGEFYNYTAANHQFSGGIYLNKVNAGNSPVWRVLILKQSNNVDDPDDPDPANHAPPLDPSTFERTIYFTNLNAGGLVVPTNHGTAFSTSLPVAQLFPGRYAIVGSSGIYTNGKYVSPIGRKIGDSDGAAITSTRRIELSPQNNPNVPQLSIYNATPSGAADTPQPPDIQNPIAIAINQPRSLSISDPVAGYPTANFDPTAAGGEGAYSPILTSPIDAAGGDTNLLKNGTTKAYRKLHLQRLANPLLAWNQTTNPYLTIDSFEVNLTAFNGVASGEPGATAGANDIPLTSKIVATNERGMGDTLPRLLWYHNHTTLPQTPATTSTTDATHNLGYQLQHSLGYLNKVYRAAGNAFTSSTVPAGQTQYVGAPDTSAPPFPWLVWNNRPFANVAELMLVPASSSSKLSQEFAVSTGVNPYDATNAQGQRAPFNHLLNFLSSSTTPGSAPNLSNLFEFLQVPSQFVGTETVLTPSNFAWYIPADGATPGYKSGEPMVVSGGVEPNGTAGLHPPFNTVSNYRDPGKININTIPSAEVWNAVLGGDPSSGNVPGATFAKLQSSLRGDNASGYAFNPAYPSLYSNPFRSPAGADMVALAGRLPAPDQSRSPVDVSIWRPDPMTPTKPLLSPPTTTQPYNDPLRNPYFAYQGVNRIANKVTTRSNVYAVWVTVGYFEVTPQQQMAPLGMPNDVYPDGYELGQELGADTGEVTRHRGFYIFDRSIPVGYERGQDHNVLDAVLLRRFIE